MPDITVYLPPEMEPYKADLEYFVSTMVRKLHTNRHKGVGKALNPRQMLLLAQQEGDEAFSALAKEGQFEFGVECADAANFMFLAARGAWQMTRAEYEGARNGNP